MITTDDRIEKTFEHTIIYYNRSQKSILHGVYNFTTHTIVK